MRWNLLVKDQFLDTGVYDDAFVKLLKKLLLRVISLHPFDSRVIVSPALLRENLRLLHRLVLDGLFSQEERW